VGQVELGTKASCDGQEAITERFWPFQCHVGEEATERRCEKDTREGEKGIVVMGWYSVIS